MQSPSTYPPDAQLMILAARLANIAQVPADYQQDFSEHLVKTVLSIRSRDRRSTGAKPGGLLPNAATAAQQLQDAFCRMNKRDRDWVEHIKQSQMQFAAGQVDDLETAIYNISSILHAALGKQAPLPPDPFGGLGSGVKDQMLRELVFGLLHAACESGGKFSFDKNSESGTLAKALRRLRDGGYLPPGLLEDPLPASRIQRLKDEFFRLSS
jgi:hypothetical protein